MKRILACVKLVPTATEVEMDGQFRLKRDGANLQINIADLSAVEIALRLKAADLTREVIVISMGPLKSKAVLTELFALGVDRVILLCDRLLAGADSLSTARALASAIKHIGRFDCIVCGRRAMDAETGQIPGQLAAALGMPGITNVQQLSENGDSILCERRMESGVARLAVNTPCLVSFCEYAYNLRLPSIMGRRWAKGKEVEVLTAADIGLDPAQCGLDGSMTKVVRVDTQAPGLRKCSYCGIPELVQKIQEVCP